MTTVCRSCGQYTEAATASDKPVRLCPNCNLVDGLRTWPAARQVPAATDAGRGELADDEFARAAIVASRVVVTPRMHSWQRPPMSAPTSTTASTELGAAPPTPDP